MRSPSRRPGPRYAPALVRFALSKDALKTNVPTASRIPCAIRWTCSSLSMTQGPAISTRGRPGAKALNSIGTGEERLLLLRQAAHVLSVGGADERLEERMRLHRLGFELGMELAAQEPGVVGDLADLDVGAVGGLAGETQAGGL